MKSMRGVVRRAYLGAMVVAVAAGTALGQEGKQEGKPQPKPSTYSKGTVLIVDYVAPSKMMPDAKDQKLAAAFEMIPARVRELPREVPAFPPEAIGPINTALSCFSKPGRLTVAYDGDMPTGGFFGYGVAFSFLMGDQKAAEEAHGTVSALMADSGQRIKTTGTRWKGMSDIQTPPGLVSFGPREAKDGWRYEIVVGTMNDADGAAAFLPPAPDMEPLLRARLDFAGLTPLTDVAKQFAGDNEMVTDMIGGFQQMGLIGDNALKVSYVTGFTKDDSVSLTTMEGAKKYAAALKLSQKPLTPADLAAVPADATDAFIARMGDDGFGYLLDPLQHLGQHGQELLDGIQDHTGVDLKADLLDALGGTGIYYMSDSTGGGNLMSSVVMLSFRDRAKAVSAMNKLASAGNSLADQIPIGPGYVKLSPWKDGDTELLTLRFPGLPVPLEITFAMTEKWLILSATPQGAIAAARQASGKGDGGLMANAAFKARYPTGKELVSVNFSDVARTLKDGYAFMALLGSAISNGVRSPTDPTRDPGMIVPVYNDLVKGVKAKIGYTYWKGDDLITESRADRSGIVGGAATLAFLQKVLPALMFPAAAVGGAMEEIQKMGVNVPEHSGRALARVALRAMPVGVLSPGELMMVVIPEAAAADAHKALMGLKGLK